MKRLILPLTCLAVLGTAAAAPAFADDVKVTITGVHARGGDILVALQTQDEFLQPRGSYGVKAASPASDGTVTVTIPGVAPGVYSVSVLHDENRDGTMSLAPNGMPKEGWAMKDGEKLRGAPTFDQAKFTVGAAPVSLNVQMLYFGG